MNEATIELLSEVKEALKKMPNDPEGLAGWLLSNYEMRKIFNIIFSLMCGQKQLKSTYF